MFDTHERILQKLTETGHKEFSAEMIQGIIDKVEDEEVDKMYEAWLRDNEPGASREAALEPVSWEEATEDLGDIPQREQSQEQGDGTVGTQKGRTPSRRFTALHNAVGRNTPYAIDHRRHSRPYTYFVRLLADSISDTRS